MLSRLFPPKERVLKLSHRPFRDPNGARSVVIKSDGLFQIGGDLSKERDSVFEDGIGIARLRTNNLSYPFAFFTCDKEYLETLVPKPFDIEKLGYSSADVFEDLYANPILMLKDSRRIVLVDPLRRGSIKPGYTGVESFCDEPIETIEGGCDRIDLRHIRFDVEVARYKEALFQVREYSSKT
jgi:hypothetical protein